MRQLSHSGHANPTVEAVLARSTRRLARARLHYGHGTDGARDDAAALLWHVMRLPWPAPAAVYRRRVSATAQAALEQLLRQRIGERVPVVYLTQRCWFAGLPMYVDQRVLIPRSPIAELIERRFAPWIERARVRRILDLGTGSGCIAIACARAFPRCPGRCGRYFRGRPRGGAHQHPPPSPGGDACAPSNRIISPDSAAASYDIIVSNPPYVARRQLSGLPAEYRHEPRLALAAGSDGLDSARIILRDAAAHLNPGGILIVEVGNSERALRRAYPRLPFTWLAFERGGGGVFVLERGQLLQQE